MHNITQMPAHVRLAKNLRKRNVLGVIQDFVSEGRQRAQAMAEYEAMRKQLRGKDSA